MASTFLLVRVETGGPAHGNSEQEDILGRSDQEDILDQQYVGGTCECNISCNHVAQQLDRFPPSRLGQASSGTKLNIAWTHLVGLHIIVHTGVQRNQWLCASESCNVQCHAHGV